MLSFRSNNKIRNFWLIKQEIHKINKTTIYRNKSLDKKEYFAKVNIKYNKFGLHSFGMQIGLDRMKGITELHVPVLSSPASILLDDFQLGSLPDLLEGIVHKQLAILEHSHKFVLQKYNNKIDILPHNWFYIVQTINS